MTHRAQVNIINNIPDDWPSVTKGISIHMHGFSFLSRPWLDGTRNTAQVGAQHTRAPVARAAGSRARQRAAGGKGACRSSATGRARASPDCCRLLPAVSARVQCPIARGSSFALKFKVTEMPGEPR